MTTDTASIMFADVSGSSRLFKQVGDSQARSIISKVVNMMMEKTEAQQGTVIKTIGDEVMASFPDINHAANAAIEIQLNIDKTNYGAPLTIQIGLHRGAVIHENSDVFGEAVNDAAALVKEAKGGQILTSDVSKQALNSELQSSCRYFDSIRLKGGKERSDIYLVQWQQEENDSASTTFLSAKTPDIIAAENASRKIKLRYQQEEYELTQAQMPFSIGRGKQADLVIHYGMASRYHCSLDCNRGKFVLSDKSTNGTHLKAVDSDAIYLRREETVLRQSGMISFSVEALFDEGDYLIHYSVE